MHRLTAVAVSVVAVGLIPLASVATAAPISKSTEFRNGSGTVTCGIEAHAPKVLCAARGIPAPTQKGAGHSGFVQLGVLGRPQVLRLKQNSFVAGKPVTLGRGRLWNQLGVTCHIGLSTVLCFNGANHGFVIGNGAYGSF